MATISNDPPPTTNVNFSLEETQGSLQPSGQALKSSAQPSASTKIVEQVDKQNSTKGSANASGNVATIYKISNPADGSAQTLANTGESVRQQRLSTGIIPPQKDGSASNTVPLNTPKSYKVKLTAKPGGFGLNSQIGGKRNGADASSKGVGDYDSIEFEMMPLISESQSIMYAAVDIPHHPGEIKKYQGTAGRAWGFSVQLISRTSKEASNNQRIINLIRTWGLPFHGHRTGLPGTPTARLLGAPPPILTLTAYGPGNIGPVKCVMTNYNWSWPNDIDYVPTLEGIPFPVKMDVQMSLEETWSPSEFSNFSILDYRAGNLKEAYKPLPPYSISSGNPRITQQVPVTALSEPVNTISDLGNKIKSAEASQRARTAGSYRQTHENRSASAAEKAAAEKSSEGGFFSNLWKGLGG